MIKEFVAVWEERKSEIRAKWAQEPPEAYKDIIQSVVEILQANEQYGCAPDPARIHEIDDGDYQGTLLYVIGANGYQPSKYWSVLVSYGSCSGCDTLQDIGGYSSEPPTKQQLDDYMTLALHVVQGLKEIDSATV